MGRAWVVVSMETDSQASAMAEIQIKKKATVLCVA